jgi:hypothetical protein
MKQACIAGELPVNELLPLLVSNRPDPLEQVIEGRSIAAEAARPVAQTTSRCQLP